MAEKRETGTQLRVAGLGLMAQAGLIVLIMALFVWISRRVPTGQHDWEHSFLSWFTPLVPAVLLVTTLLVLARGFLREAKGVDERGFL